MMLFALVELCNGLSGRALRKLPFLAHALFAPTALPGGGAMPLDAYLIALRDAAEHEQAARCAVHEV